MAKTERKIKNNYVMCKDGTSERKDTLMINFTNSNSTHSQPEISKLSFTRVMPVGKGGFGKVWKV